MSEEPRREAQARADQVRAFRRELRELAEADVVQLPEAQEAEIAAYHDALLARLARDFDVDRSEREGQLSRSLRLASIFGAATLVAAITALVHRVWGDLSLPAQVTLLTAFPLMALAGVQVAAEREQTRYVAGLFALVACGTAWFAIGTIPRLLDLPHSSLLLWLAGAFGIAVAASYGFRLVFSLSIAVLLVASGSVFFAAGGVPWPAIAERPEPLLGAALVCLIVSAQLAGLGEGFDRAARHAALAIGLSALLALATFRGTSLLAFSPGISLVLYQAVFVPVTLTLLWRTLRSGDRIGAGLVAAALALFLVVRYVDWFWDRLPAWLFFLVLAGLSFVCIAALRRARSRAGAA